MTPTTTTPAPLEVTVLPFAERFVLVREYDLACMVRIDGEAQSVVNTQYLPAPRRAGRWTAADCYPVPVVYVETRKGTNDE